MGLYVCDNCRCVENTALGHYHGRNIKRIFAPEFVGKKLCSQCGPEFYADGKPTGFGEWHGKFPKQLIENYIKDNPKNFFNNYDETKEPKW